MACLRLAVACAVSALLAGAACDRGPPAPPRAATPSTASPGAAQSSGIATPADPPTREVVLAGAGDIASCASAADTGTAALLDRMPGGIFTLGDNAYPDGTPQQFAQCYGPTWGRHRDRTRPVIGNHDYHTTGARGYFDYFGATAGRRGEGWYSYQAGGWHIVVLNSNCDVVRGGCRAGSPQERWLRADLAASSRRTRCAIAMWHHPLFTSGGVHGPTRSVRPLFEALYDAGVEVLLSAHNHQYERFAPQAPDARRDDRRGVRQFVVGTGGADTYRFGPPAANSQVRLTGTHGVLRLTLADGAYQWQFVPVQGPSVDTGGDRCH